jgi:hypothetical protein
MLPRLRFVVASLAIAILPMVLLGSGVFPTPHSVAALEIPRADKPIVLGPGEYSEAQYRQDRQVFAYARRATELSRLRELASAPLSEWVAAPAGAEADDTRNAKPTETLPAETRPAETQPAEPKLNESRAVNPKPAEARVNEVVATLSMATIASDAPATPRSTIPLTETVAEQRTLPPQEKPLDLTASPVPSTVLTQPVPQVYVALTAGSGNGEVLRTEQPPVGYFAPLPKSKPKAVKRTNRFKRTVARPVVPAQAQAKPPFGDLFLWLFGQGTLAQAPAIATAAANKTAAR